MADINSLEQLEVFSHQLLQELQRRASISHEATVLALSGDLGSGKTTLVQTLAKQLGVVSVVTSPTFTIMKIYPLSGQFGFEQLVHIDAYRIESLAELKPLRLAEWLEKEKTLICIEWAELIAPALPLDSLKVNLHLDKTGSRSASVMPPLA